MLTCAGPAATCNGQRTRSPSLTDMIWLRKLSISLKDDLDVTEYTTMNPSPCRMCLSPHRPLPVPPAAHPGYHGPPPTRRR